MGIVNITEDSFSGDGLLAGKSLAEANRAAIEYARAQWEAGADILDIGAESTKPGSVPLPPDEEWRRLSPILQEVCQWNVAISVDTYRPQIMQKALDRGVDIINDIHGFRTKGAWQALATSKAAGVVMHMQGTPETMQVSPSYDSVVETITHFFQSAESMASSVGIAKHRLIFDPGFGFGKSLSHNIEAFRALTFWREKFGALLVGISRKSMLGAITGREAKDRLSASIAGAVLAMNNGARILRVHDVAATVDAVAIWQALSQ